MEIELRILKCGNCEPLKLGVHAGAFGLAVIMGLYNAAAWLSRRETHLAINAVLYAALTAWETEHVRHHFVEMRRPRPEPVPDAKLEPPDESLAA
jgi:hypothetical protein